MANDVKARNEAARRLGIPVCEVCSSPDCEVHNLHGLNRARLCMTCYVDWLRREVRREVRELEQAPVCEAPEWAR